MKVNNYYETSLKIYEALPFSKVNLDKYVEAFKIYDELKDPFSFLEKIGCSPGLIQQILKTVSVTSEYFFSKKTAAEQERLSLEFIFLFSIVSEDKEIIKKRILLIKTILANNCKINSNFEMSVVELISGLYLIYCINQTFLGTSLIFFSFLEETESLLKEGKFEEFYSDFVLNDRNVTIIEEQYEQVQYKELIQRLVGKDNSNSMFKQIIEFFAGGKLEIDDIDEENVDEIILTSVKMRLMTFDHINFEKLLEVLPQFWNPKEHLQFLLN